MNRITRGAEEMKALYPSLVTVLSRTSSSADLPSGSPDGGDLALAVALPILGWDCELKNLQRAQGHTTFSSRYEEIDFKVVVGQMLLVNAMINESTSDKAILSRSPVARTDHLVAVSGYVWFLDVTGVVVYGYLGFDT
jgi:hypothetical protein